MTGPIGDLLAGVSRLLAKGGLWLGVAISLVLAIGSIVLVVLIVINWPADHFKPRGLRGEGERPRLHVLAVIGKNIGRRRARPARAGDGAARDSRCKGS